MISSANNDKKMMKQFTPPGLHLLDQASQMGLSSCIKKAEKG